MTTPGLGPAFLYDLDASAAAHARQSDLAFFEANPRAKVRLRRLC